MRKNIHNRARDNIASWAPFHCFMVIGGIVVKVSNDGGLVKGGVAGGDGDGSTSDGDGGGWCGDDGSGDLVMKMSCKKP